MRKREKNENEKTGKRENGKTRNTHHTSCLTHNVTHIRLYALMVTFFLLCKCVLAEFFLPCVDETKYQPSRGSSVSTLRWMPIYLDDGTELSRLMALSQVAKDENCRVLQCKTFAEIIKDEDGSCLELIQNDGNHSSPNVSPDGTKFSYVSATKRESKMWLYNLVTRQHTQLKIKSKSTSGRGRRARYLNRLAETTQGGFAGFSWSDNSKYYVFSHAGDLYLGAVGISEPIKIYEDPVYAAFPRWSKDLTKLLFTSGRTGKGDIYLIDNMKEIVQSIGSQSKIEPSLKQLTGMENKYEKEGEEYFTSWTKDGGFIYQAYGKYGGKEQLDYDLLKSVIPDGRGVRVLRHERSSVSLDDQDDHVTETSESIKVANLANDQIFPRCSPDGESFAFYSNRWFTTEKFRNDDTQKFAIFAMEIPDNDINPGSDYFEKNQKTYAALRDSQNGPLWSPDGKFLIYIADSDADKYPICVVQYNRGLVRNIITDKRYVNNTAVDLAEKTGKIITFCTQVGSASRLHIGVTNFR